METFYIFILIAAAIVVILWWLLKKGSEAKVRYYETDLRLTYKRFMELYPNSEISYQEYKKLQARKAYKRAVSSRKIKRMVR
jgi:hypothetical protein